MNATLSSVVEEYLDLKSTSTTAIYKTAFHRFNEWYKGNLEDFLNKIYKEMEKPPLKQKRIAELTLTKWIKYLTENNFANKTIHLYISAVQNFLKSYRIIVSKKWIGNLPKNIPKKENEKHEWTLEQIKEFFNLAINYRDKALILCLFQSGQGIYEIVHLNYGNIRDELEDDIIPMHLKLVRQKTEVEFRIIFGRDAIKYLKLYLETRRNLTDESPLFTLWGRDKRITKSAIEKKFRELAENVSFIKKRRLEKGYNPVRPQSLRAAFDSLLTGKIDRRLIDFFMGRAIGEEKRTYLNIPTDELRELYKDCEKYLAVEKTSRDELSEVTEDGKLTEEHKQKIRRLEKVMIDLTDENEQLKEEIKDVRVKQEMFEDTWELALVELQKQINSKKDENKSKSSSREK